MKTRTLATILTAVTATLALTACGGQEQLPESTPSAQTSTAAESTAERDESTPQSATDGDSSVADDEDSSRDDEADEDTSSIVDVGESCGTRDGMVVVALEDGTTCDIAMDVLEQYSNNLGEAQGQALFWTAPNGWGCYARYKFPGEEDSPDTRKISCSAEDPGGNPASEGSGGVAEVKPGDEYKVLIDVD